MGYKVCGESGCDVVGSGGGCSRWGVGWGSREVTGMSAWAITTTTAFDSRHHERKIQVNLIRHGKHIKERHSS